MDMDEEFDERISLNPKRVTRNIYINEERYDALLASEKELWELREQLR